MKTKLLLICFFVFSFCNQINAQSSGFVDSLGVFQWQYHRSVYKNAKDTTSAVVVIVFINGANHSAISYRQEVKNSTLHWEEKETGSTGEDGYVKFITAKLKPNEAIVWRFIIKNNISNNDNSINVEKGAILIMDEQFNVRKEKFAEQNVK
jgi:hypothetical protein